MRKLQRGQKASLGYNTVNKLLDETQPSNDLVRRRSQQRRRENCITIYNDTDEPLERYDVVALGPPTVTPSGNLEEFTYNVCLMARVPGCQRCNSAICVEPIPVSGYGLAAIDGVVPAYIHYVNPNHEYAECIADQKYLTSNYKGLYKIIWTESDETGLQYAVVRFEVGHKKDHLVRFITGIAASNGTVAQSGLAQRLLRDTVTNELLGDLGTVTAWSFFDSAVSSGILGFVTEDDFNDYWITALLCEPV